MRKKYAILVAAGKGLRMKEAVPKQFLSLLDKPLLYYTINAFLTAYNDLQIILVLPASAGSLEISAVLQWFPDRPICITRGGATRFDSVKEGLKQVEAPSVIFVHDGVRPLITPRLIRACYEQTLQYGSAIPAIKLKDSIRQINEKGNRAVNRDHFRSIQTPQTFLSEILLPAFDQPFQPGFTDEATVVEHHSNQKIHLIEGEEENIKITRPFDLQVAGQVLLKRSKA